MNYLFKQKGNVDIPVIECIFDAYGNIVNGDENIFKLFNVEEKTFPFSFIKYINGYSITAFWRLLSMEENDLTFHVCESDSECRLIFIHMKNRRNATIIDLSNIRLNISDLEKENNIFKAINSSLSDMYFINDTINKKIKITNNKGDIVVSNQSFNDFKNQTINEERIHPDDIEDFIQMCNTIDKGDTDFKYQLRSNIFSNEFHDYTISGKVLYDEIKKPIYVVGGIKELGISKDRDDFFKDASNLDSLTKVLNKESMKNYIIREIQKQNENQIALMIIDIDDFKKMNDTYGHLFGDLLLVEFTSALKKIFLDRGVLGRIGGDEFCVMLNDSSNLDIIITACKQIIISIKDIYATKIKNNNSSVTIGVSQFPLDGCDYETLFSKADKALYYGKRKGKNCYVIYDEQKHGQIAKGETEDKVLANIIVSSNNVFIGSVIETLMNTNELDNAINLAFAMIGNRYLIDRIILYRKDENFKHSLTYQWGDCEMVALYADYLEGEKYQTYFSNDNIYAIYNIATIMDNNYLLYVNAKQSGTKSVVQYLLESKGKIEGIISYEMTSRKRSWQNYELDCFIIVSRIIGSLLNKKR